MRPANIITAISDVIAGAAICGFLILADHTADWLKLMFLVLSTIGLYGGGIVFNDVCYLELDKVERP